MEAVTRHFPVWNLFRQSFRQTFFILQPIRQRYNKFYWKFGHGHDTSACYNVSPPIFFLIGFYAAIDTLALGFWSQLRISSGRQIGSEMKADPITVITAQLWSPHAGLITTGKAVTNSKGLKIQGWLDRETILFSVLNSFPMESRQFCLASVIISM